MKQSGHTAHDYLPPFRHHNVNLKEKVKGPS